MNDDLRINTEQVVVGVPVTIFHIDGWLGAQSESQLADAAQAAHDDGATYLLIDMEKLDTLTSAGMRGIQKVYKIFTPREEAFKMAHLKLCKAPPQIYNVLYVTGFLRTIPMYESLESALETFGKE